MIMMRLERKGNRFMMRYGKSLIFIGVVIFMSFAIASCMQIEVEEAMPAANQAEPIDIIALRADLPPVPDDIEFSKAAGFYNDSVMVELKNSTDDYTLDIRYTTDGSEPTASSSKYTSSIRKNADSDRTVLRGLVVRAALFEGEKRVSRIFTNTYILGYSMRERFDVPVVCVSTGNENLWNHEYGIFADGRLREEWWESQPPRSRPDGTTVFTAPANWWQRGIEWERPSYVEIFEPDGTRVVAQDAGLRIHGGWSRGNGTQRSLRIFARSEYDPDQPTFDYDIFPNNTTRDGTNTRITSYKRLLLRNGGNDFGSTRIRDEVTQDIADLYGLDMQNSRAAVIFLDGEVYGIIQIKQTYSRFTLQDTYNAPNDNFTILKQATSSGGYRATEGDPIEESNYASLVKNISRGLAKTEDGREEIERLMDVYDVLKYYAFQIYIGNGDWPHNNFKLYKYNEPELNAGNVKRLDGRWRYLLYDTDFGMGLAGDYKTNILASCMNKGDGGLFAGLMQSDEYKNMFAKLMCDLINVYYTRDILYYYIGVRSLEIVREIPLQLGRTGWNQNVAVMYDWVERRPAVIYTQLTRQLRLSGGLYQIKITQNTEGGSVHINQFELTDANWTGSHYENTGAEINAAALPGWKLEKWIINGTDVYDAVISLDEYISDGSVDIEAIFVKDSSLGGILVINELYYAETDDNANNEDKTGAYIELYNPTNSEISTDAYSIIIHNHDENTETTHKFTSQTVAPFSYLTLTLAENNLKSGRDEVRLMRSDTVQESVYLPECKAGESYGRYPDGGEKFVYLQTLTDGTANNLGGGRVNIFEYMKNKVILTGRLQDKTVVPIRLDGETYVPLAAFDEYNGNNPREVVSMAKKGAIDMNGDLYVPISVFDGTRVLINEIILEKFNSVIIYK